MVIVNIHHLGILSEVTIPSNLILITLRPSIWSEDLTPYTFHTAKVGPVFGGS